MIITYHKTQIKLFVKEEPPQRDWIHILTNSSRNKLLLYVHGVFLSGPIIILASFRTKDAI